LFRHKRDAQRIKLVGGGIRCVRHAND
jgi:hypothetical protein